MALINQLRNKMGIVVVVVISFAILAFILADFLGPGGGGSLLNSQSTELGEIAGQEIETQQYQSAINEIVQGYQARTGREPSQAEMVSLRQQAWDLLISRIGFRKQLEVLGITVTAEELQDIVQGENIDPNLKSQFTDPETGEFDRQRIIDFLASLRTPPTEPEAQAFWQQSKAQWDNYESQLAAGRTRIKYDNLLVKTNYVTNAEAQQFYQEQNATAEIQYLYAPFYAIGDSVVEVTDNQLAQYLKEHADAFQVEESRSLKYVSFPIVASPADSSDILEELMDIKEEFGSIDDDSSYAQSNTDFGQGFDAYSVDRLPAYLQNQLSELEAGNVYGPNLENGSYLLYKLSSIEEDTVQAAKARHILIKPSDDSETADEEAKLKAEGVLRQLRNGADFAQMALENSDDPSNKTTGGDLGWFSSGVMVPEFQEPVFGATQPGLINRVVESQFGYHIIDVTEPKTNKQYKVATILREITPSQETREVAYRKAEFFRSDSPDLQRFEATAQSDSINVFDGFRIDKNSRNISTLNDAREVVRWLYNEASEGEVSEVFELDNEYVLAVMTGEQEEGTAKLEDVREELTVKVKNKLKGDLITKRLNELEGSLEDIASGFGADAKVYTTSDLKLNSTSLANVGNAPLAIGRAFSLKPSERSEPIIEDNGVLIVEQVSLIEAPEVADYNQYKEQIRQQRESRDGIAIGNAIREHSDIIDKRYKSY